MKERMYLLVLANRVLNRIFRPVNRFQNIIRGLEL